MNEKHFSFLHKKIEQQEKIIVQLVEIVAKTNRKLTDVQNKVEMLEKVK